MAGDASHDALLSLCAAGELSPEITLMRLLLALRSPRRVAEILAARSDRFPQNASLIRLLETHAHEIVHVAGMLDWVTQSPPEGASAEDALLFWQGLFDQAAAHSEEASVALYSLGSPFVLAAATAEIVEALERWRLLSQTTRVLDLGCGIGRLSQTLAGRVAHVHGVDLSDRMLTAARRRCTGLTNVSFSPCSGRDLAGCLTEGYDLVLAVDSFPFIVSAGPVVVETMFEELARVSSQGGFTLLLNYSYRSDFARDKSDLQSYAAAYGFALKRVSQRPFALWDGAAFLLQRRSPQ